MKGKTLINWFFLLVYEKIRNHQMPEEKRGRFTIFLKIFLTFIYFWEREGDTGSEASSRLWAVSTEPHAGLELKNCEIMTWAEVGRLTDWGTQAPLYFF